MENDNLPAQSNKMQGCKQLYLRFETLCRDNDYEDYFFNWEADRMLHAMAKNGISGIFTYRPGQGASCAVHLAQFSDSESPAENKGPVEVIPGTNTHQEFLQSLVMVDPLYDFIEDEELERFIGSKFEQTCGYCSNKCHLNRYGGWSLQRTFRATAERALREGLNCPFPLYYLKAWYVHNKSLVIIDVPRAAVPSIAQYAGELLKQGLIVLLVCLPEHVRKLTSDPYVASLQILELPKMGLETLVEIARYFEFPLTEEQLYMLANIAGGNPRRLIQGLQLIRAGISIAQIQDMLAVNDKHANLQAAPRQPAITEVTINEYIQVTNTAKVFPQKVSIWLGSERGIEMSAETVGRNLRKLGFRLRRTNRGNYYLPPGDPSG